MMSSTLHRLMQRVAEFSSGRGTWFLVGGFLRDQLLARPFATYNIDVAVPRDAIAHATALAEVLGATVVPLDETFGTARLVVSVDHERIELDLAEFRGPTIEDDLRHRDFTVNAMAVRLTDWVANPEHPAPLIDPLHGQAALASQRLIPCWPGTFHDDALRILRAARFVAQLGFSLDDTALPFMREAASRVTDVAGERIRDELMLICATPAAATALTLLSDLRILDTLFPELALGRDVPQGGFHHLDVLHHELETVRQADRFLADFAEFVEPLRAPLASYCETSLVEGRSRYALIKWAGLFHDVGKPAKRTIEPDGEIWFIGHEHAGAELMPGVADRLKFSNRESHLLTQLVRHHLRPGFLSREPVLTRRAIYRFYKDLGDDGPACLLLWWADRMATRGPKSHLDHIDLQRRFVEEMLDAYFFKAEEVVKPPRFIDGNAIMTTFGLKPGPLIGQLLNQVEEAQAEGRLHTYEEAVRLIRQQLQHS